MSALGAVRWFGAAALALSATWALAQNAPESLLPPGFEQPRTSPPAERPSRAARDRGAEPVRAAPRPAQVRPAPEPARPAPEPPRSPTAANTTANVPAPVAAGSPAVQPSPVVQPSPRPQVAYGEGEMPPLDVLERMSPDEIERALGLRAAHDIPADARRSADNPGILDESEGGMALGSLSGQDASLVRAAIAGNDGMLVSRWGHILLRRALASRLAPPAGMAAADFAGLRAALLVRMGEADAARALVQDVDTGDYTPLLSGAALDAYVAAADFTGICPAMGTQGSTRTDPQWQVARTMCRAFEGDSAGAFGQLDRAQRSRLMPRIDLLLAQKYIGSAGRARRAVTIDWDGVDDLTPWRYGLALAVGLEPPERLLRDAGPRYGWLGATAPMLGLAQRAAAADAAGRAGVLSSAAMVDLYGQIHADPDVTGAWSDRAGRLRAAYTAPTAAERLAAMQALWSDTDDAKARYARLVLTAYAAARLPVSGALSESAGDLVASMLAAGLDANALRWAGAVPAGSDAWAQLALASPDNAGVDSGAVQTFIGADASEGRRRSAFLLAGLAGLGRIDAGNAAGLAGDIQLNLGAPTRWTRAIDAAAQVANPELVALLAGVGMQGEGWDRMTPRFLFHIVAALRQVGLEPEARMIAAEAVARG